MTLGKRIKTDGQRAGLSQEKKRNAALWLRAFGRSVLIALLVAVGYLTIYLIGRVIWCEWSSLTDWLFLTRPSGKDSYLYGWLLSSHLFWYAMAISVCPALFGKHRFSVTTLIGFAIGLWAGISFGPYPQGAVYGHGHRGWAIWGMIYFVSMVAGVIVERWWKKRAKAPPRLED